MAADAIDRTLQKLSLSGGRTCDLRGVAADGELHSSALDESTTALLLDNNGLQQLLFARLHLPALSTLSLSNNRLQQLEPDIGSFAASLRVLKL